MSINHRLARAAAWMACAILAMPLLAQDQPPPQSSTQAPPDAAAAPADATPPADASVRDERLGVPVGVVGDAARGGVEDLGSRAEVAAQGHARVGGVALAEVLQGSGGGELQMFVDEGLLIYDGAALRLTRAGMLLAHEIMAIFIRSTVR